MKAKEFGMIIRAKRKSLGLTKVYVAALCNVGTRFIIELENGKETIQLEKALKVADVLGLRVELL